MKIVTLASMRGAPGVTTTALLLASTVADGVLVEADLDGGVLAVRYGLGREPGLTTFAAGSEDHGGWRVHAQDAGGVPALVGPDAPGASSSLWRTAGERITRKLIEQQGVAVVDAGRLRSPVPVVAASDIVGIVLNPVAEQLVALSHMLPSLRQTIRGQVGVVVAGTGPYRSADIQQSLDVTVLAELPDDPNAAEALRIGGATRARLARSRLARAVTAFGAQVATLIAEPVEAAS